MIKQKMAGNAAPRILLFLRRRFKRRLQGRGRFFDAPGAFEGARL